MDGWIQGLPSQSSWPGPLAPACLAKLNSFHDSVSGPGPWVFLFRSTALLGVVCFPCLHTSGQPIPNSTINARGAHPLDPLPNITPSNLFCFFLRLRPSLFIVPAKPCLSPDNGGHHPTRETRTGKSHTHAHTQYGTRTCSSRPRTTKQSGRGSCHLELNPAEPTTRRNTGYFTLSVSVYPQGSISVPAPVRHRHCHST